MAIKKRVARRPGKGSATVATPALISMLADPGDISTTVRLAARVGVAPLDKLDDENEQDVAGGVDVLRRLWILHRDAAMEYCLKRHGPGCRPALWWDGKNRPYVRARDWTLGGDYQRFAEERAASDLRFLSKRGLLTKEEKAMLEEARKERRFGPQEKTDNEATRTSGAFAMVVKQA